MPGYYNPYMSSYPVGYAGFSPYSNPIPNAPQPQQPTYMINVDGENAAKTWQPQMVPAANTIIPLFDSDGQHVYFKTYDGYGRMNPIRKGRIVFDDEVQTSEQAPAVPDMNSFATKEDLNKVKEEIIAQLHDIWGDK